MKSLIHILCPWGGAITMQELGMICGEKASSYHRQTHLIENLRYPDCLPLASRVVAKSHFIGSQKKQMQTYLQHHLTIAGIDRMLFEDDSITAIYQGSGGIFRKANHLARGALVAAAI